MFGDNVPGFDTALLVAVEMMADMTELGEAAGTADKYRAAIPAT